jgi:hypothetical protein
MSGDCELQNLLAAISGNEPRGQPVIEALAIAAAGRYSPAQTARFLQNDRL